jgi:TRAP-type C4-dicarboxylate transport system permease small subunit
VGEQELRVGAGLGMPTPGPTSSSRVLAVQRGVARFTGAIDTAMFWIAAALLIFMTFALFVQVLFRYVVKQPVPWTEEGARFALIWFSIAAATIAAREGQHFVFRWATLLVPKAFRYWLRRLVDLFVVGLLALIFVESLSYLEVVANQTAPGTGINMRLPYAGITIGSATLLVIYVGEIFDAVLAQLTGVITSKREVQEESMYAQLGSQPDQDGAA